jgi:spore germination protein YaaH
MTTCLTSPPQASNTTAAPLALHHDVVFDPTGAHTVWYVNARSLQAKIDLAAQYQIAGVFIWRRGPGAMGRASSRWMREWLDQAP